MADDQTPTSEEPTQAEPDAGAEHGNSVAGVLLLVFYLCTIAGILVAVTTATGKMPPGVGGAIVAILFGVAIACRTGELVASNPKK